MYHSYHRVLKNVILECLGNENSKMLNPSGHLWGAYSATQIPRLITFDHFAASGTVLRAVHLSKNSLKNLRMNFKSLFSSAIIILPSFSFSSLIVVLILIMLVLFYIPRILIIFTCFYVLYFFTFSTYYFLLF